MEKFTINETERNLAHQLFRIIEKDGKTRLAFSPELEKYYDGGLHSPLQQLSSFCGWGSLIPPSEKEIKSLWLDKKATSEYGDIKVFSQLRGSPSEIFLSLLNMPDELQEQIDHEITNAAHVMLFGAISIPSVVEALTWLKTKQFRGRLLVYDISSIPILIGRLYQQFGLIPADFNVEFIQSNVLSLPKNTPEANLIISDVLGYYLSPKQYTQLINVIKNTLSDNGTWLTRELVEPNGPPPPHARSVSKSDLNKRINTINEFVNRIFGVELPFETIQQFENQRWALVKTYSRQSGNEYLGNLPPDLKILETITISTEELLTDNKPRIFQTSIIKK